MHSVSGRPNHGPAVGGRAVLFALMTGPLTCHTAQSDRSCGTDSPCFTLEWHSSGTPPFTTWHRRLLLFPFMLLLQVGVDR
jgi:hypothetical protein